MPAEEPLERAVAEDVTVAGESRAKLLHGDVRRLFEKALDQRALRLDAGGAAISAERSRPGVALTALQRPPAAHARRPDAEAGGGLAVAGAVGDCLQDPGAKIEGKRFRHVRRPPSPADILNQITPTMGIPNDSIRWASALVSKAYQIDVAGYTLRSFTEANIGHIRERLRSGNPIRIRMLMVDPSTPVAKAMQDNEGHPPGAYTKSHKAVRNLLEGLEESVELRTIGYPLPAMIYRIDDVLYTGPYPKGEPSKLATTYKVSRRGWMFEKMMKEFNNLWSEANPVSIQSGKSP